MNEAELLFTHTLDCDRASLYLDGKQPMAQEKGAYIASVLKRRMNSEPIQYILGKAEFMGLEFKVAPGVLIPRPETEILVETAIESVVSRKLSVVSPRILDLGTGSGCIAVSLAKFLPGADITAVDISDTALKIAADNARAHNVKINFIKSDLLKAYSLQLKAYDLIVTNPPYIPTGDIDRLQPELKYEPRIALDGGKDGLEIYRRIIEEAPYYLKSAGALIVEIGCGQADVAKKIAQNSGKFKIIEVVRDYNQIDRVVVLRK